MSLWRHGSKAVSSCILQNGPYHASVRCCSDFNVSVTQVPSQKKQALCFPRRQLPYLHHVDLTLFNVTFTLDGADCGGGWKCIHALEPLTQKVIWNKESFNTITCMYSWTGHLQQPELKSQKQGGTYWCLAELGRDRGNKKYFRSCALTDSLELRFLYCHFKSSVNCSARGAFTFHQYWRWKRRWRKSSFVTENDKRRNITIYATT